MTIAQAGVSFVDELFSNAWVVGGIVDAGAVVILFGSAAGITGAGNLLTQTNAEPGDAFGSALAAVDGTDLAVGAPGEDVGAAGGAGAVSLVADAGTTPNETLLHQGVAGVVGTAEAGDVFGSAVIAGDFNQSEGLDSLAIGAPGEDVGAVGDAGAVNVRYAPGFGGGGLAGDLEMHDRIRHDDLLSVRPGRICT